MLDAQVKTKDDQQTIGKEKVTPTRQKE